MFSFAPVKHDKMAKATVCGIHITLQWYVFLNPNSILHISLTVSNFSHHLVLDNLRYGTHITFLCVNKSSTIAGSLVTFVSSDVLLDGNFTTGVA